MKIVLFVGYFAGCIAVLNATPPGRPRLEPQTSNQLITTSTTEAPAICLPDEFRCEDNYCIAAPRRCDGYPDCRDGSDEIDCLSSVPTCGPNQFTCTITRQCVLIQSVCNNRTECSDGTDEVDCPDSVSVLLNIRLIPLKMSRPIGSRVRFTCSYESSERLFIRFVKNYTTNNEILLKDANNNYVMSRINHSKWEGEKSVQIQIEPNLQFVICQVVDRNGLIFGTINAKISPDTSTQTPRPFRCRSDEYECMDGHCIPLQRRCDGFADCRDKTDELGCAAVTDQSTTDTEVSTTTEPNQPKPGIVVSIREPAIQSVALGTTIRYNCRAQSAFSESVIVEWSKEDSTLPPTRSVDDGNGNLVVINAQTSDTGVYVCTAYDYRTYVSQRVYLTVAEQSAPKVSLVPTGSVTLSTGQSLSVRCEATGAPLPTVKFYKSSETYGNKKSGLGSTVFTIQFVRKSDEGVYYCRAYNLIGYDTKEIAVYVNDIGSQTTSSPPDPSSEVRVTVEPSEFIGSSGDQINLQCTVSANIPYRIIWTRYPDLPLQQGINERDGRLFINSASQQDSGVYVCSAISEQTGNILSQIEVNVNVAPSRRPALLTIEPERQTVAQRTLAKISCIVGNDPNARVTWRKANENLPAYFQQVGNELQIPQVDVKDRGVYVCELNYSDGNILQVHSILEVQRREAPAVEIYPKDKQTVFIGDTALIRCNVSRGEPSPTLTWSRTNNQQLSSDVEVLDGGVLRFSRITEEDEGQYICTASNLVGSVTSIATLELISPPIITLNPRGPYIVPLGQSVRIECTARGRPAPAVFWLDQNIGKSHSPVAKPQTAVFEIHRTRLADSKTYTCVADNSAGRVEEKIVIIVQDDEYGHYPPPNPNTNNVSTLLQH